MRGQRFKNIVAENITAGLPMIFAQQNMSRQKRMCWKCQKDKSTKNGHIKTFAGSTMKFICSDCLPK